MRRLIERVGGYPEQEITVPRIPFADIEREQERFAKEQLLAETEERDEMRVLRKHRKIAERRLSCLNKRLVEAEDATDQERPDLPLVRNEIAMLEWALTQLPPKENG
jgi:hypothetical protein